MRPYMVVLINCKNILLDGPTFKNSPKFTIVPYRSENVIIRNVKVNNEWWAQNGDGIDVSACKNVLLYNCTVTAGDDAICMKSSGKSQEPLLQNVVIADCIVYHGHGGFVIGSNIDGGMKNISVKNCTFIGTDIGLRFKSAVGRGGIVENVYIDSINMKNIVNEAILFNTYYEQKGKSPSINNERLPVFRNFYINNVICNGAEQAINIAGLPQMPVQSINISNSFFSSEKGFESLYAKDFHLDNIRILSSTGPVITLDKSNYFSFNKIKFPEAAKTFMLLKGEAQKKSILKILIYQNCKIHLSLWTI